MSNENRLLIALVVMLVCGVVTYIAFLHPALGIALGGGVAVATLVWVLLHSK